jgi:hypothetical protein
MDNNVSLNYYDKYSILIITEKGFLTKLNTPFQVRCIYTTSGIKVGTLVFVEAVISHDTEILMYRVLKFWIPYNYFRLVI